MTEINLPDFTDASCIGMDTDIFYDDVIAVEAQDFHYYISTKPKQHAMLRRICLECPVVNKCRDYGISHELYGFWGGMTAMERQSERVLRGIELGGNDD